MIFDCCIIRDEIDILMVRLSELWEYVDIFVIVEADKTFTGEAKPFHLEASNISFLGYKVRYIKVTDMPKPEKTNYRPDIHFGVKWNGQFHQRNAIMRGLSDLKEEDIVMISDVDEIWDPKVFNKNMKLPIVFEQMRLIGYMNILANLPWYGTIAVPGKMLLESKPQDLRMLKDGFPKVRGGWHFTWCGGLKAMAEKMQHNSHPEEDNINRGYTPEKIMDRIIGMQGMTQIDVNLLPKYVKDNLDYFKSKEFIFGNN